ncbi:hypothetical protein HMPREF3027_08770 [Porphyromonas sp. HMSC077F02]|uniref:DUF2971 domain-containing protein n=1 Tax=Porphyromonas sp. HMSC077F02 TaxID=1739529 RepID=UPI0008A174D9|nr:DUF2971 domain-containing protein [Porphyromonas sp. HMSC077F02]OFO51071.1 hypothetical protein HMPREF3027_08770 [Porphyromonas sp. HMSC077F02]
MKPRYYKYRSLKDLERFLDIILNKRLYGAVYTELNDPMEGKFNKTNIPKKDLNGIYEELRRTRICSLMRKEDSNFPDDFLMWSHYADGHRGCCIELELTGSYNQSWTVNDVTYMHQLPIIANPPHQRIAKIITTKADLWKNEKETRAYRTYDPGKVNTLSPYYHIKLNSVYLGKKLNKKERDFYHQIIKAIDSNIQIYRIIDNQSAVIFPSLGCSLIG